MSIENRSSLDLQQELNRRKILSRVGWVMFGGTLLIENFASNYYGNPSPAYIIESGLVVGSLVAAISLGIINKRTQDFIEKYLAVNKPHEVFEFDFVDEIEVSGSKQSLT